MKVIVCGKVFKSHNAADKSLPRYNHWAQHCSPNSAATFSRPDRHDNLSCLVWDVCSQNWRKWSCYGAIVVLSVVFWLGNEDKPASQKNDSANGP